MNNRAYCLQHAAFHRLTYRVHKTFETLNAGHLTTGLNVAYLGQLTLVYTDNWNLQIFIPDNFSVADIDQIFNFLELIHDEFVPGFFSRNWSLRQVADIKINDSRLNDLAQYVTKRVSAFSHPLTIG